MTASKNNIHQINHALKQRENQRGEHLIQALDDFLLEGNQIDERNVYNETLLTQALQHAYTQVAQHLLKQGADVNLPAADGTTPLEYAYELADRDLLNALIQKGATLREGITLYNLQHLFYEELRTYRETPISKGVATLEYLVTSTPYTLQDIVISKGTALNDAIVYSSSGVLKYLLDSGLKADYTLLEQAEDELRLVKNQNFSLDYETAAKEVVDLIEQALEEDNTND